MKINKFLNVDTFVHKIAEHSTPLPHSKFPRYRRVRLPVLRFDTFHVEPVNYITIPKLRMCFEVNRKLPHKNPDPRYSRGKSNVRRNQSLSHMSNGQYENTLNTTVFLTTKLAEFDTPDANTYTGDILEPLKPAIYVLFAIARVRATKQSCTIEISIRQIMDPIYCHSKLVAYCLGAQFARRHAHLTQPRSTQCNNCRGWVGGVLFSGSRTMADFRRVVAKL